MKRYKQYKPTGISWLPEIPAHWEEKRLATRFHGRVEANSDFEFKRAFKFNYGSVVPKNEAGDPTEYRDVYVKYSKVLQNDILINGLNLNYDFVSQRVAIVPERGIVTSAYVVLRPFETTYAPYFCYLFKAMDSQKLFHGLGTGIRLTLSFDELKKQLIPIPPIEEQKRIDAYLDKKITLIESCKCQRKRELQTLNELKQAEIASVVTRGLNPNVPMKDSGIFWQPLIPDNWTVTKLKHVLSKLDRPRQPDDELLVCSNSGEVKKRGDSKLGLVADSNEIYQGVTRGDLLIHGMDTWHGAIAVSNYDGMCTPVVHVCDSTQNKKYIALYLRNMAYQKVFKLISNGVRQNTSDFRSWGKVGTILIPIPPIEEQDAIVKYIESKNSKIDKMIDALTAEIERLTEYKQRLISDVVTGQVDVRGEVIA